MVPSRTTLIKGVKIYLLSSEFNLKPSPLYRHILALVEEERLSKDTLSRQEALKLVEEFLKKKS